MTTLESTTEVQPWLKESIHSLVKPLDVEEIKAVIHYVQSLDSKAVVSGQLLALDKIFTLSIDARAKISEVGVELKPRSLEGKQEAIYTAIYEALSPFLAQQVLQALSVIEADHRVSKLPQIAETINSLRCRLQATLENNTETTDSETIRTLVKVCMKLLNLSQKEIAEQSGIAQGSVSNLIKGQKQKPATYKTFADWLETKKGALLEKLSQTDPLLEAKERSVAMTFVGIK